MRVQLSNVCKEFFSLRGRVLALKDINLQVADGEFFVLLGPSGCGKSTLLNLIAGLEQPTVGQISFDDKLVAHSDQKIFLTPRQRNVAFVFQSYALYPHLTVFENIAFPLRIARMKTDQVKKAVESTAETLQIHELLAAKPGELSGGQRQRVAIARAIVRQPNLFLLDEPLSNLDAQLRGTMRAELKTLQNKLGITTIYVTHDQVEALSLGDRIAVLKNGQLEQIGTPRTLYENPATPFVAQFIGSPPMNLLRATFTELEGRVYIHIGAKKLETPIEKVEDFRKLKENSFILGIRPEHISVNSSEVPGVLNCRIESVQPLGRETLVCVSVDNCKLLVLSNEREFETGQQVSLRLDLEQAHIFSVEDFSLPQKDSEHG